MVFKVGKLYKCLGTMTTVGGQLFSGEFVLCLGSYEHTTEDEWFQQTVYTRIKFLCPNGKADALGVKVGWERSLFEEVKV